MTLVKSATAASVSGVRSFDDAVVVVAGCENSGNSGNSGIGTYPASASTLAARGATKDGGARGDAEVEAGRGDAGGECVILFARLLRVLSSSSPSSSPSAAAPRGHHRAFLA